MSHSDAFARAQVSARALAMVGLGLASATPAGRAWAQSTARADGDARLAARTSFDQGVRAIDEGRYADAVRALEESYRLRPAPVVLNNLGIAYRGLGRLRDAINSFREYLADPPQRATRSELAVVEREIDRLEQMLGRVRVSVEPAGAFVQIDGRAVNPGEELRLDPGEHVVDASAQGFRSERRAITVEPGAYGEVALRLVVEVRSARLLVEPSSLRAAVLIDGVPAGTGRVEQVVEPGMHRVEVRAAGFEPLVRTVRVASIGVTRVDATLRPTSSSWIAASVIGASVLVVGTVALGVGLAAGASPAAGASWGGASVSLR